MDKNLPVVAIVGRANVGKSSLFNRIVGAQDAIVAREAGTTRDAVYRIVEQGGQAFWLVDTAGLKPAEDEFEATIQEQIEEATDSADLILVVVEASTIITDEDRRVAKKALKSKKPVILVTNKSDLAKGIDTKWERLGVKDIVATSATQNRGTRSLLQLITANIPTKTQRKDDNYLKIALLGRPNAGKSYLFNTLAKKQQAIVANVAGTTRDINRTTVKYNGQSIELLDTAGIRRPGKIEKGIEKFSVLRSLQAIDQADVCLLLMDVSEYSTALDQKIAGMVKEAGKGLIIVISKWDSLDDKDSYSRDHIAGKLADDFVFVPWAPLLFTSAVSGQNVTKIFDLATEIYARRQTTLKTTQLNHFLSKATSSHPPASHRYQPKLRYMVQDDINPPTFRIYGYHSRNIHWSYRRYLERGMRESFDLAGTPIKIYFIDEKSSKPGRIN